MKIELHLHSAGAASGLIELLKKSFETSQHAQLTCNFAAVQLVQFDIQTALRASTPIGLGVVTPAVVTKLQSTFGQDVIQGGSLGFVETGFAAWPDGRTYDLSTVEALRNELVALDGLLVPDMENSTGGRHLKSVLDALGLKKDAPPIKQFPGGTAAVAALKDFEGKRVLACAQQTEINLFSQFNYVGGFPDPYKLLSEYVLVLMNGSELSIARKFAGLLTGIESLEMRRKCGFVEVDQG